MSTEKDTPNNEDTVTRSAEAAEKIANRILAGLTSKRSDEEWEHYMERTIDLFRQKGLFKNEPTTTTTNL
jgi:hypothetical protein